MTFFQKVKMQWNKISWLQKKEVGKQVLVVVMATLVSAVMISAIDTLGKLVVNAIMNFRF